MGATGRGRVSLTDLIFQHRHAIAEAHSILQNDLKEDALGPEHGDHGWLLRYVLGFPGKPQAAAKAASRAIAWRRENQPIVFAARMRAVPPGICARDLRFLNSCFVARYQHVTEFGDPVFVVTASTSDLKALMEKVSEHVVALWLSFLSECAWQYCVAESRRRDVLVWQLNVFDAAGFIPNRVDRRFFRVAQITSEMNEWLRPQFIHRHIVFNAPRWARAMYFFRTLLGPSANLQWVHTGNELLRPRNWSSTERLLSGWRPHVPPSDSPHADLSVVEGLPLAVRALSEEDPFSYRMFSSETFSTCDTGDMSTATPGEGEITKASYRPSEEAMHVSIKKSAWEKSDSSPRALRCRHTWSPESGEPEVQSFKPKEEALTPVSRATPESSFESGRSGRSLRLCWTRAPRG